jgi:membrane-associated phospholipid phosphatase
VRHRPSRALWAAFACLAGLFATGVVAYRWPLVRANDASTRSAFTALAAHPQLTGPANAIANAVDPLPYALIAVAYALIALVRRRVAVAVAVPAAMVAASAATEVLKPLVAHVRSDWFGVGSQLGVPSWPSGHATAAMMVALGGVLVAPATLRPLVALLGSGLAIGVSYSILMLGWHFPSDVLGGFLVAGLWTALAIFGLNHAGGRRRGARARPRRSRVEARGRFAAIALLALGAGGAFGVLLVRGRLAAAYATAHLSFVGGALAIALLAAVLAAAAMVAMHALSDGSGRAPTAAHRRRSPLAPG